MNDRLRVTASGKTSAIIYLSNIEPAPLSIRHPLGINLDLAVTFLDQRGTPVNPTPILPQLALLPRSRGGVSAYDMTVTNAAGGVAEAKVPGTALVDPRGFNLELYLRRAAANPADPPLPIQLAATGALILQGGAYMQVGPLGMVNVPVVRGPVGPVGPQGAQGMTGPAGDEGPIGPQGDQGTRGGIWFVGDDYPMNSLPGPAGLVDGDMYLKSADPNIGSTWRRSSNTWIAVVNIMGPEGPIGPEGPQGPQGVPGASGTMTAIVSETPPPSALDGQFWYRPTAQQMFIRQGGFWVLHTADWA